MVPFKKQPLACALSSLALMVAPSVFAQSAVEDGQESASDSKKALETIVVTATRRAESVADIPYNISAIGEEEMRKRNITDLKTLIKDSVDINAPDNSARFADSVTVRGLNVSQVSQNNLEYFVRSTLAYYLDETPLPNIGYRIKDVARVEKLMGPQGTLYGSGSLGGTIRFITNKPAFDESSLLVNSGVYQTRGGDLSSDTDMVVNLPLAENVALRASLAYLDEGGFTDRRISPAGREWSNPSGSDTQVIKNDDYQDATTGKVAVAWRVADDLTVTLTHAQQDQFMHGSRGSQEVIDSSPVEFQYGKDVVVARYDEFAERDFRLDSIDFDWDLGSVLVSSSTSYFEDSREGQSNYADGFLYYGEWGFGGLTYDNSDESPYVLFDNTYSGFSHETRVVSQGDSPLSWIAGVYYTEQERSLAFSERFPTLDSYLAGWRDRTDIGGAVDEGYAEDINTEYEELALFGELTYALSDNWDVTVGARIFNYSDIADPKIKDYAFGLVDTRGAREVEESGQSIFKLNTSYDLSEDVLLYATASQGFRRGGINGFKDIDDKVVSEEIQQYEPDTIDNYELGIKGTFLDGDLYIQSFVYRMDWHDTQTYFSQSINGFPLNGTTNGPDSRSEGWEFSSQYALTDNWSLSYATTTVEAEWADTKLACAYTDETGCRDEPWTEGGKLGGSPKWRHNLGVSFVTDLANGMSISAGLRGSYVGETQFDRADDPDAEVYSYPEYTLYSASMGLSADRWNTNLWVNNLTNERAEVSYERVRYIGSRTIHTMPRTVGLNVSYDFW